MNNYNWIEFWENYRNTEVFCDKDLYYQVGKTINGNSIPEDLLLSMLEDIKDKLNLGINDILLEMCCGNGLLSKPLSAFVDELYAFDFTARLIGVAKEYMFSENVTYKVGDAKGDLNSLFSYKNKPNKFLMNDSLGYFTTQDLYKILKQICNSPFRFYITGIPCDSLKWNFYNTEIRKERYFELVKCGDESFDGIGKWWNVSDLIDLASELNLGISIERQALAMSNFRVNALYYSV
jgi:hypothetical protein